MINSDALNPCFSLSILHNSFNNQGSKINKNNIFLSFDIFSFTKTFFRDISVVCRMRVMTTS